MSRRTPIAFCLFAAAVGIAASCDALPLAGRTPGQYFDSNGVQIYYTDEGSSAPVILVHGLSANADLNWRVTGVTPALAKEFRVIALDLRGHGLSGKPHDAAAYGTEMCEDVVRLMDHLKIAKAHVVGYSLGGFITLKLAVLHPERLLSIGVCGAGWDRPESSPTFRLLARSGERMEANEADGNGGRLGGGRLMGRLNDREALAAVMTSSPTLALTEEQVRAITLPICSVAGERDPERFSAQHLREVGQHVTFTMVPGAGHLQVPGRPEFLQALLTFLRAQPAA